MKTLIRPLRLFVMFWLLSTPVFSTQRAPADLRTEIVTVLAFSYRNSFNIEVSKPGIVTIAGTVPTYWDWLNVFAIVSRVHGVKEVRKIWGVRQVDNKIKVVPSND